MATKPANSKQAAKPARANPRDELARAALAQAGLEGWERARPAGIPEYFRDKTDLLAAIGEMIDRETLHNISAGKDDSSRDRLFDILMERFEVMNQYRDGLISVMQFFRYDPVQAMINAPYLCRSMHCLLEAAGIETSGGAGALKIAALTGIFLRNMKVWAEDEGADLSKTMAALDRDLGRAEKAAGFLKL